MKNTFNRIAVCLLAAFATGLLQDASGLRCRAQETASPGDANTVVRLPRLFDEVVLQQNAPEVCRRSQQLNDAERLNMLRGWVLPASRPSIIRLQGHWSSFRNSAGSEHGVEAPVLELLKTAHQLDCLPELRQQVAEHLESVTLTERLSKAAFLVLADLQLQDELALSGSLGEYQDLMSDVIQASLPLQWAELLVATEVTHWLSGLSKRDSRWRDLPDIFRERVRFAPETAEGHASATRLWSLSHVLQNAGLKSEESAGQLKNDLPNDWIAVDNGVTSTRDAGAAESRWVVSEPAVVRHVAGHRDDFLLYHLPLQDDFEIIGEMASGGTTQLLLAGNVMGSVGPDSLASGSFREGVYSNVVSPPFRTTMSWVSFRAVFQPDRLQLFLNDRLVRDQRLSTERDPWIGFRTSWNGAAVVRNVQIVGKPRIPETVDLLFDSELTGWVSDFTGTIGQAGSDWQYVPSGMPDGAGELRGARRQDLAGTRRESLVRYCRPLRQADALEYEFYYVPDEVHVHPVLNQHAFLLEPSGVRRYELTEMPDEQPAAVVSSRLPLQPDAWNRVTIEVENDHVVIGLNGTVVCDHRPERSASVEPIWQFGLFHFADATAARVRNIRMRGSWPNKLPDLAEQTLADPQVGALIQTRAALGSLIRFDFAADGLNSPLLKVSPVQRQKMTVLPQGLQTTLRGQGRWTSLDLMAGIQLVGDFDIEAEFEQLEHTGAASGGIALNVEFEDDSRQLGRVMRMVDTAVGSSLQVSHSSIREGERIYDHYDYCDSESDNGRLRLSRRGDRLDYLFSHGDSGAWRMLGTRHVTSSSTIPDGIMLQTNCDGMATCRVVWKSLVVAAQQIIEHPGVPEVSVAELDEQREKLAHSFRHDFATSGFASGAFGMLPDERRNAQQTSRGIRVSKAGPGTWSATGIAGNVGLSGDFDAELEFENLKLTGNEHSGIVFSVLLSDPLQTQCRMVYLRDDRQRQTLFGQVSRFVDGNRQYESLSSLPSEVSAGRLRIARRGSSLHFLFAENGAPYQLVSRGSVSEHPSLPAGLMLESLTNGTSSSSVVWKSLQVRAEKIVGR